MPIAELCQEQIHWTNGEFYKFPVYFEEETVVCDVFILSVHVSLIFLRV